MHKFRASSLGLIMTDAQSIDPALLDAETLALSKKKVKTDEDKAILAPLWERSLSAGAKTYIESLAKQLAYGYEKTVSSKFLGKGVAVEDDSIALYNSVFFTDHKKNAERRTNDWITGEADIVDLWKITDIKSSWSVDTFPATAEQARDKLYEWQLRAYMWLWECDLGQTAHCLVDTPDDLIGYEDPTLHHVGHINAEMRVTLCQYERDKLLEEKIRAKCEAGNRYLQAVIKQIELEHSY